MWKPDLPSPASATKALSKGSLYFYLRPKVMSILLGRYLTPSDGPARERNDRRDRFSRRCFNLASADLKPAGHDDLLFAVKRYGVFAVGVKVSEKGVLPAGEGEEGHGGGDSNVDAHHAHFDSRRVLAR